MSDFLNENLWFKDVADFEEYLAILPQPDFKPIGLTYHNTFVPNARQWLGPKSMVSMQRTYEGKEWDRGPHIYLAAGTRYDGIFVMTPPNHWGIHAGSCNGQPTRSGLKAFGRFGCELVWDGDVQPFSAALVALFGKAGAALLRYAKLTDPNVVAHRDCMPGRTCPGRYGYAQKDELRQAVADSLTDKHIVATGCEKWIVKEGVQAVVHEWWSRSAPVSLGGTCYYTREHGPVEMDPTFRMGESVNGKKPYWFHLTNGEGFSYYDAWEPFRE